MRRSSAVMLFDGTLSWVGLASNPGLECFLFSMLLVGCCLFWFCVFDVSFDLNGGEVGEVG